MKRKRGFTLVELLIVVAIIAILFAIFFGRKLPGFGAEKHYTAYVSKIDDGSIYTREEGAFTCINANLIGKLEEHETHSFTARGRVIVSVEE